MRNQYISASDVCEMLSIHRTTLYSMVKDGKITAYELGTYKDGRKMRRYKLKDIEQFIEPKNEVPMRKRRTVSCNFIRK